MLSYLKLYIIKKDENINRRVYYIYQKDFEAKHKLVRKIRQIFDAINVEDLVEDMLANLDHTKHVSFKVFSQICEIHLFEITPGLNDVSFNTLLEMYEEVSATRITLMHDSDDDDDDDSDDDISLDVPVIV